MKTIFIPFDDLGLGGVQTKIIDLANAIARRPGYRVVVFLKHDAGFSRTAKLSSKVTVWRCPWAFPWIWKGRYYYLLIAFLAWYRPWAAFLSLEKTSLLALRARTFLPWIPSRLIVNIDTYPALDQQADSAVLRQWYGRAFAVIAPSLDTYTDLHERIGITDPPLRYIPNWTSMVRAGSPPVKSLDAVFIGRFDDQKRPLMAVALARRWKRLGIQRTLVMYGDGPYKARLTQAIIRHKLSAYIRLHEPVADIRPVLRSTRVLYMFSAYEGLPFAALEAMACQCVVAALDAPGVRDAVKDGQTGILKRQLSDLLAASDRLFSDRRLYRRLQRQAAQLVADTFSVKNRDALISLMD